MEKTKDNRKEKYYTFLKQDSSSMSTKTKLFHHYSKQLEKLKDSDEKLRDSFTPNFDWCECGENIDLIICGDNPGKTEHERNKYFTGDSGSELSPVIELLTRCFSSRGIAFFNKTVFFSNTTKALEKKHDPFGVIQSSINLTVDLFYGLSRISPNLKICIFGHSETTYIVKTFYGALRRKLEIHPEFEKHILAFSHPSNNHLMADMGRLMVKKLIENGNIELDIPDLFEAIRREEWKKS